MKKIFILSVALVSLVLSSCEKTPEVAYTLTINPTEVNVGDEITLTITGDNVAGLTWTSCFNNLETDEGSCLVPNFKDGVSVVDTKIFDKGTYEFYAECHEPKIKTNKVKVIIK